MRRVQSVLVGKAPEHLWRAWARARVTVTMWPRASFPFLALPLSCSSPPCLLLPDPTALPWERQSKPLRSVVIAAVVIRCPAEVSQHACSANLLLAEEEEDQNHPSVLRGAQIQVQAAPSCFSTSSGVLFLLPKLLWNFWAQAVPLPQAPE